MLFDIMGILCCRNEGSHVGDAVATLILASRLVWLDMGTGAPTPTTPTEERVKVFRGISNAVVRLNSFCHGKMQIFNLRYSERKLIGV